MSQEISSTPGVERPTFTLLDIIRAIVLIAAIATFALWGFTSWAMPWNIIVGIGVPVLILLLWALFLSPRPVLRLHPFLRAAAELIVYASVTLAWWSMGQVWIGLAFAVVAVTAGVISGRRALA